MKNFQFSIFNLQLLAIFLACFILLPTSHFLLSGPVLADTTEPQNFIYQFHLYYDNGQLFADRNFEFKYDVIPETFAPETLNTQFPYKGEVINLKGEVAKTFQFDPRQGNPKFLKGKISVKAPYVPDGQKAVFYDSQGQSLLSIFVSDSSFCNDDGVCNPDVGEDSKTCPNDCKSLTPAPVVSTEPSADNGAGGMLKGLIYLIIGLAIGGGFWYWRKKRSDANTFMPPIPPDVNV